MNIPGEDMGEILGVLLAIYWPLPAGMISLALLGVAINKKPPRAVRLLSGVAGGAILLAGLVIVFRGLLG